MPRYKFIAKTNQNGSVHGSHKNHTFEIKGFYYQERSISRNWIIIVLKEGTTRLKFEEENIEIEVMKI